MTARSPRASALDKIFLNRRAFAGPGRADQLEVLGLIVRRDREPGET